MKFSIFNAILVAALSFSAFAETSIRCTSATWESATQLKFDHTFQLVDRPDYQDQFLKTSFDLVPGITVLVEAIKDDSSSDTRIHLVIANSILEISAGRQFEGWFPYASAVGNNSLVLNLNSKSITSFVDYNEIPLKKLTESAKSYKKRIVEALEQQKNSNLRTSFYKQFGELATVYCRKI